MIWRWLHRHPLLFDLALMAVVFLPTAGATARGSHPVAGVLLVALETAPLILRRTHPLATVAAVAALACVIAATGFLFLPFQLGVALYTLAAAPLSRPRRTLGFVAIGATTLAITAHYESFGEMASRVVFLIAAWLLGDSVGSRHAYVREIEAKAERLERERDIEARRVVAEEQARIARELHDVVRTP